MYIPRTGIDANVHAMRACAHEHIYAHVCAGTYCALFYGGCLVFDLDCAGLTEKEDQELFTVIRSYYDD